MKYKYYEFLLDSSKNINEINENNITCFSTPKIAEHFDMKTNIINHHLNELFKDGKLIKINSKPVYFLPKELIMRLSGKLPKNNLYKRLNELKEEINISTLEKIIGSKESLSEALNQCRVAISYPENGLPLLITGDTGTGKTFLVKQLHKYAIEEGILDKNSPLSVFNCAEYADNPELLATKLFGHVKGAYTGASSEGRGLIEASNGGILFIDEVHRLSPESQEKLFFFMDEGKYKKIGESDKWRSASVRMMFATTENIYENLITTFLRRIPIVIKLPDLNERTYKERKEFLYYFLRRECRVIRKPIFIDTRIISFLCDYNYYGNVGELENIVKLSCGNAFVKNIKSDEIYLNIECLPSKLNKGLLHYSDGDIRYIRIKENEEIRDLEYISLEKKIIDFKDSINCKIREFVIGKISKSDFMHNVYTSIEEAYMSIDKKFHREVFNKSNEKLDLYKVNKYMNQNYQIDLTDDELSSIKKYILITKLIKNFSIDSPRIIFENILGEINIEYKQSEILLNCISKLNNQYEYILSEESYFVVSIIISYYNAFFKKEKIQGVIICHGKSTATSIASATNKILGAKNFRGIDMDLYISFEEIIKELKKYLSYHETRNGLIILIDIGHINDIKNALVDYIEGPFVIIDNASTRLALDVGNRINNNESIKNIATKVIENNVSTFSYFEPNKKKENALILCCQTGIGTAKKLEEIFLKGLPPEVRLETITVEFEKLKDLKKNLTYFTRYNVVGIIGTADPEIKGVEFLGLDDIMGESGFSNLQNIFSSIMDVNQIHSLNGKLMRELSLENLVTLLSILNPQKTISMIEDMMQYWEYTFNVHIPNNLKTTLYIHISCMIERVITKNYINEHIDGIEIFMEDHEYFVKSIKKGMDYLEKNYHTEVSSSEIQYLHKLFTIHIKDFKF